MANEVPEHLTAEERAAWEKSLTAAPPPAGAAPTRPTAAPPAARSAEQTLHLERSALEAIPAERTMVMGTFPAAPRVVSVTVRSGPDTGSRFALETSPLYIGRAPDNGITVNDPATSRRHARFEQRGQDFLVVDLGSANGTLVDGVRVVERVLADGSVITMGQNEFLVSIQLEKVTRPG
jgi:pSer/pThr/pTyr-binding forkhead associated (FHA) protein